VYRGFTPESHDYEITADVTVISDANEGYARIAWRMGFGSGNEYAVSILLNSDQINVSEWTSSVESVKGSETSVGITDGTVVHFRIRADGSDHKVRWWLDADPEPGTWNVEFTDATLTTGSVAAYLIGGAAATSVSVDVDNFTLTYLEDGSTPPPDESITVDFTGTNGDAWPAQLAAIAASTGATATIQSNRGRLTTGTLGGYSDSIFRGFTPTSQNYEITVDTVLVNNTGNEGYARLAWRQQTSGAEYAASVALGSGNVSVFEQDASYVATVRAQQAAAVSTAGQVVHWKVRAEGTTHKAKWWIGAATEPTGWNAEFTDSTLTDGRIVLYLNGGSGTTSVSVDFDNFTVTYLDEEEPEPTGSNTLPTALSSTHGSERTLVFSSKRNIWGTTNFGNEVQRYTDDGIVFTNGGTSMVMTADDGAATATGYKSGATNNYDANISPVTPGSYIQARLKCPVGQGFWPAFWMMPSAGGSAFEVDILEQLGDADRFDMNQHFDWNGSSYNQSFGTTILKDVTDWFNVGCHLHANRTDYYVDGVLVWTVARAVTVNMAVAINFALGGAGSYPGSIDGTTPFPSTFEVESVKVWTATGSGGGSGGVRGVVSLAGAGGGKGAYNMGSGCDHPRGDFQTRDTWGNGSGGTTWDASNWATGKAIIEEAAAGLGQFIIHGFSIGGMFAQEVVHRGETFGGRLKGVVIDDPARNWGVLNDPNNPAGFVNPAGLPIALYGTRNAGNTAWFVDEFYSDFGYMEQIATAYGVTLKNSATQPAPYTAPGVHRPNTRSNNGTGPNAPVEIADGGWWD
jgi:outer membrane biogenesis lipoprotein LolB